MGKLARMTRQVGSTDEPIRGLVQARIRMVVNYNETRALNEVRLVRARIRSIATAKPLRKKMVR